MLTLPFAQICCLLEDPYRCTGNCQQKPVVSSIGKMQEGRGCHIRQYCQQEAREGMEVFTVACFPIPRLPPQADHCDQRNTDECAEAEDSGIGEFFQIHIVSTSILGEPP